MTVRLHPDDKLLLTERAAAWQMAVAMYISVLIRAHLRDLSPLPKAELMALKQAIAELGAIGRTAQVSIETKPKQIAGAHQGIAQDSRSAMRNFEVFRDRLLDVHFL